MRKLMLSLARIHHWTKSYRVPKILKTRAGPLSFLFAIAAATDEKYPPNCPPQTLHSFAERPERLDRKLNLFSQNTSWRDIPQLVHQAAGDIRNQTNNIIERRMESEGGRVTTYIAATNFAVYVLWKIVPTGFMVRHFANSLESIRRARVWTTLTSNFSHMGLLHLASNMYLLDRFGSEVADILGSERFCLFYGAAGVASSLASLTFRRITKSNVLSLGASGAVVATLWLYACFFPDRRMSIFGSERTLTMQELVIAYTVIDAAGLLGSSGKIDFAAHLGGALFGNSWFHIVREKLIQEHSMRKSSGSKSEWQGFSPLDIRHSRSPSKED